jgi:DNA-binding Lrp family transcriptional regulator
MKPFFVQIKCDLGRAYDVATALADAEIASEIYSTAGGYDLLVKFYLAEDEDVGHFINEKVHSIAGVKDTYTIITFRAFGSPRGTRLRPAAAAPCRRCRRRSGAAG